MRLASPRPRAPERQALDLYLMLDASYSMFEDTAGRRDQVGRDQDRDERLLDATRSRPAWGWGCSCFRQVRSQIPEDCYMDTECKTFGPCLIARACSPANQVERCDTDAQCGAGRTCVPLGSCTQSNRDCLMPGYYCGAGPMGTPAGNTCQQIPGYCIGRDICEVTAYSNPTVPITVLPGGAASISGALAARRPEGLTPTAPALAGAIEHARARLKADPTRKVAVVLASDGLPSACTPNTIAGVTALARDGAEGVPGVPTFALGVVGPSGDGGVAAPIWAPLRPPGALRSRSSSTPPQDVTRDFQAALATIRATALACEFKLPTPAAGALDYGRVNVQLTAGDGTVSTIANVENKAACDPARGGWYYGELGPGGQPTMIYTCGATCHRLREQTNGQVDIVLGCRTIID